MAPVSNVSRVSPVTSPKRSKGGVLMVYAPDDEEAGGEVSISIDDFIKAEPNRPASISKPTLKEVPPKPLTQLATETVGIHNESAISNQTRLKSATISGPSNVCEKTSLPSSSLLKVNIAKQSVKDVCDVQRISANPCIATSQCRSSPRDQQPKTILLCPPLSSLTPSIAGNKTKSVTASLLKNPQTNGRESPSICSLKKDIVPLLSHSTSKNAMVSTGVSKIKPAELRDDGSEQSCPPLLLTRLPERSGPPKSISSVAGNHCKTTLTAGAQKTATVSQKILLTSSTLGIGSINQTASTVSSLQMKDNTLPTCNENANVNSNHPASVVEKTQLTQIPRGAEGMRPGATGTSENLNGNTPALVQSQPTDFSLQTEDNINVKASELPETYFDDLFDIMDLKGRNDTKKERDNLNAVSEDMHSNEDICKSNRQNPPTKEANSLQPPLTKPPLPAQEKDIATNPLAKEDQMLKETNSALENITYLSGAKTSCPSLERKNALETLLESLKSACTKAEENSRGEKADKKVKSSHSTNKVTLPQDSDLITTAQKSKKDSIHSQAFKNKSYLPSLKTPASTEGPKPTTGHAAFKIGLGNSKKLFAAEEGSASQLLRSETSFSASTKAAGIKHKKKAEQPSKSTKPSNKSYPGMASENDKNQESLSTSKTMDPTGEGKSKTSSNNTEKTGGLNLEKKSSPPKDDNASKSRSKVSTLPSSAKVKEVKHKRSSKQPSSSSKKHLPSKERDSTVAVIKDSEGGSDHKSNKNQDSHSTSKAKEPTKVEKSKSSTENTALRMKDPCDAKNSCTEDKGNNASQSKASTFPASAKRPKTNNSKEHSPSTETGLTMAVQKNGKESSHKIVDKKSSLDVRESIEVEKTKASTGNIAAQVKDLNDGSKLCLVETGKAPLVLPSSQTPACLASAQVKQIKPSRDAKKLQPSRSTNKTSTMKQSNLSVAVPKNGEEINRQILDKNQVSLIPLGPKEQPEEEKSKRTLKNTEVMKDDHSGVKLTCPSEGSNSSQSRTVISSCPASSKVENAKSKTGYKKRKSTNLTNDQPPLKVCDLTEAVQKVGEESIHQISDKNKESFRSLKTKEAPILDNSKPSTKQAEEMIVAKPSCSPEQENSLSRSKISPAQSNPKNNKIKLTSAKKLEAANSPKKHFLGIKSDVIEALQEDHPISSKAEESPKVEKLKPAPQNEKMKDKIISKESSADDGTETAGDKNSGSTNDGEEKSEGKLRAVSKKTDKAGKIINKNEEKPSSNADQPPTGDKQPERTQSKIRPSKRLLEGQESAEASPSLDVQTNIEACTANVSKRKKKETHNCSACCSTNKSPSKISRPPSAKMETTDEVKVEKNAKNQELYELETRPDTSKNELTEETGAKPARRGPKPKNKDAKETLSKAGKRNSASGEKKSKSFTLKKRSLRLKRKERKQLLADQVESFPVERALRSNSTKLPSVIADPPSKPQKCQTTRKSSKPRSILPKELLDEAAIPNDAETDGSVGPYRQEAAPKTSCTIGTQTEFVSEIPQVADVALKKTFKSISTQTVTTSEATTETSLTVADSPEDRENTNIPEMTVDCQNQAPSALSDRAKITKKGDESVKTWEMLSSSKTSSCDKISRDRQEVTNCDETDAVIAKEKSAGNKNSDNHASKTGTSCATNDRKSLKPESLRETGHGAKKRSSPTAASTCEESQLKKPRKDDLDVVAVMRKSIGKKKSNATRNKTSRTEETILISSDDESSNRDVEQTQIGTAKDVQIVAVNMSTITMLSDDESSSNEKEQTQKGGDDTNNLQLQQDVEMNSGEENPNTDTSNFDCSSGMTDGGTTSKHAEQTPKAAACSETNTVVSLQVTVTVTPNEVTSNVQITPENIDHSEGEHNLNSITNKESSDFVSTSDLSNEKTKTHEREIKSCAGAKVLDCEMEITSKAEEKQRKCVQKPDQKKSEEKVNAQIATKSKMDGEIKKKKRNDAAKNLGHQLETVKSGDSTNSVEAPNSTEATKPTSDKICSSAVKITINTNVGNEAGEVQATRVSGTTTNITPNKGITNTEPRNGEGKYKISAGGSSKKKLSASNSTQSKTVGRDIKINAPSSAKSKSTKSAINACELPVIANDCGKPNLNVNVKDTMENNCSSQMLELKPDLAANSGMAQEKCTTPISTSEFNNAQATSNSSISYDQTLPANPNLRYVRNASADRGYYGAQRVAPNFRTAEPLMRGHPYPSPQGNWQWQQRRSLMGPVQNPWLHPPPGWYSYGGSYNNYPQTNYAHQNAYYPPADYDRHMDENW
ncbi:microtubule-associated protein futsch-like isoform X2 [Cloeon dipterum]|uniref:microtubule-associated protein futsch-like isoform X2 n=1 Tax=Cloeon dipterum TaxID=197152 RepID=UPI0032201BB0